MRCFLRLSYNGAPFHGWQSQPNASSVQQTVEDALSTIFRGPMAVTGAGRTDTGVNAREMFAHFDFPADYPYPDDKSRFLLSINRLCGRDIAVHDIMKVADDAHARFDAISRTYKYFVALGKSPFLYPLSWQATSSLDIGTMNRAARVLIDTDDFTSFAKLHSDAKTNICKVSRAEWSPWANSFGIPGIVFTITADRFLRNMVRAVVGTLVDVGRGKLTVDAFKNIIGMKDRRAAGTSMPPQALYLWEIRYPYIPITNT